MKDNHIIEDTIAYINRLGKKYKELEAENKELGSIIGCKNGTISTLANIIDRLKAENAELKAENERLKEEFEIESLTDNTTGETFYRSNKINKLKEELATYGATGVCEVCSDKANKLADKYLGCLQEIKEIADALACKAPEKCYMNQPDMWGEVYGCDIADDWKEPSDLADCPSKIANAILQLINESEVEGE